MNLTNKTKKIIGGSFMTLAWAFFTISAIVGHSPALVETLIAGGVALLGLLGIVVIKPAIGDA